MTQHGQTDTVSHPVATSDLPAISTLAPIRPEKASPTTRHEGPNPGRHDAGADVACACTGICRWKSIRPPFLE